jgi:tetratricopeptide (TPR) repeat protein
MIQPQRTDSREVAPLLAEAFALHQAGRLAEAERIYTQILVLAPGHFDALHLRGFILHQCGDHAGALAQIEAALRKTPDNLPALNNRGLVLNALGRFDEALASYARALALRPDFPEALINRGNTLKNLRRYDAALTSYSCALALEPDDADAHSNCSAIFQELKRFEEALTSCDRALALRPDFADAHSNRGNALNVLGRFDEALLSCDRALALRPHFAEAHSNRGSALQNLRRFEEALASCDRALALRPDLAETHSNRGSALQELRRFEEALASFDRAAALRPDFAEAHSNAALCLLLTGDLDRGWRKYEWRWQTDQLRHERRNFAQPQWAGSDEVASKTVFVYAEQGLGDTIQFCRYVPLIAARAGRVILEVQRPLLELMQTLAGGAQIIARGDPLPDFDLHCPLLSLPLAFGTRLATIPAATPYLRAVPQTVKTWDARLGPRHRPRIGLAWSGKPTRKNDWNRSILLKCLLPILDGIDATFVSVQRDVRDADAELLQKRRDILHFGQELENFADTAALLSNLDLIVSIDTGVAHLAGALAKPVWALLPHVPDWRWLLDREDSPWYPTARLFRQDETRAWDGVVASLKGALHDRFGAPAVAQQV